MPSTGYSPVSWGVRSPGKVSPLRGRTMKEYEEQLAALRKENFALKLRIYFLEERVDKKGEKEDKEQLYRTNIELKVGEDSRCISVCCLLVVMSVFEESNYWQ